MKPSVFQGHLPPLNDYIKDLRAPLPHIPLLPTGGVNLGNIREFIKAGAVGCGVGSALVNAKKEISRELTKKQNYLSLKYQITEGKELP